MDLRLPDTIQLSLLDKDRTADIAGVVDNSTYYRIILAHICHDADQSASCDDVHIYLDPILGAFVDRKGIKPVAGSLADHVCPGRLVVCISLIRSYNSPQSIQFGLLQSGIGQLCGKFVYLLL